MIRVKTILGKIFSLKISDKQLFSSATDNFNPFQAVCPICGAKGCCIPHAFYSRDMISIENGIRSEISVTIPRLMCTSCGHTHAVLSDVLIPYGSYTLRFILTILHGYLSRNCTVEDFCNYWEISISTLYGWIHLFEEQASLWLGILEKISKLNTDALQTIENIDGFPSSFFEKFQFSFLQNYKTSLSNPAANSS